MVIIDKPVKLIKVSEILLWERLKKKGYHSIKK